MKTGNQLKPQDVLVLLKIVTGYKDKPWRYSDLAKDLHMSQSEVHSAIKRAERARLYDPLTKRPIRASLGEYLISGLRYVFPAVPGREAVGIPTAHSAPPLNTAIVSGKDDTYIWPFRGGRTKGLSIEPLYPAVPGACAKDEELHKLFALVDALRVGRTREVDLAKKIIKEKAWNIMNAKAHNIHMVEVVAAGLKALLSEVVFVGGATTTLYLSEKATKSESSVRPTDDVDCIVEVTSRSDYTKLEKKVRSLGFKHSMEQGAPVCRWIYSGVTVDIMPTDSRIIGFTNKWYKAGIAQATTFMLPSGVSIRIFTVPYFIASKMEAFKGRGKNDFLGSRDFEDIITVLDGREDIRTDLIGSPADVGVYLRDQFQAWTGSEDFLQGISAHLPVGRRDADGARRILDIVKNL